MGKQFTIV